MDVSTGAGPAALVGGAAGRGAVEAVGDARMANAVTRAASAKAPTMPANSIPRERPLCRRMMGGVSSPSTRFIACGTCVDGDEAYMGAGEMEGGTEGEPGWLRVSATAIFPLSAA